MLQRDHHPDTRHHRLRTAGRIIPEMQVRLFDGDRDVTDTGRGQPPAAAGAQPRYLGGTDHDKLYTADGWMRMVTSAKWTRRAICG